jgi:ferric-dicitrate binding protein FerR (iron transport regulator)
MADGSNRHFDENEVSSWVQALPTVAADEDFHKRLRSAFVNGQLEPDRAATTDAGRREKPRIAWGRWLIPMTAAAALLLAIITLNRPPELRVIQVAGQGDVRVDGRAVSLNDMASLTAGMQAGSEIETPPETLVDLMAEDVVLFEVAGGSRISIPKMPGRWFEREVACSLFVGEVRIKTGNRFPGSQLTVFTPEGIVEVTSTLLSIQRDEGGTCVCVLEGVAHVGVDRSDMQPVEPGYRKVMLRDGTVEIIPVKPMHRAGVLDFDKRVGQQIK